VKSGSSSAEASTLTAAGGAVLTGTPVFNESNTSVRMQVNGAIAAGTAVTLKLDNVRNPLSAQAAGAATYTTFQTDGATIIDQVVGSQTGTQPLTPAIEVGALSVANWYQGPDLTNTVGIRPGASGTAIATFTTMGVLPSPVVGMSTNLASPWPWFTLILYVLLMVCDSQNKVNEWGRLNLSARAGDDHHNASVGRVANFVFRCGFVPATRFAQLDGAPAFGFDAPGRLDVAR
jgi:hypothetical protein